MFTFMGPCLPFQPAGPRLPQLDVTINCNQINTLCCKTTVPIELKEQTMIFMKFTDNDSINLAHRKNDVFF